MLHELSSRHASFVLLYDQILHFEIFTLCNSMLWPSARPSVGQKSHLPKWLNLG